MTSIVAITTIGIIYGEDIRRYSAELVGTLATETMEQESLKVQTKELASAVVQTILNDSEITSKAASFLKTAADTPETQQVTTALLLLLVLVLVEYYYFY